jgi:hypothetical protein
LFNENVIDVDCADITIKTGKGRKLKPILAQKVEEMKKL